MSYRGYPQYGSTPMYNPYVQHPNAINAQGSSVWGGMQPYAPYYQPTSIAGETSAMDWLKENKFYVLGGVLGVAGVGLLLANR